MKLKIWNEETAKKYSDDQLFLKLEYHDSHASDDIHILVVDKDGKGIIGGSLLSVESDLRVLVLHTSVSYDIPLKTNANGALIAIGIDEYRDIAQKSIRSNVRSAKASIDSLKDLFEIMEKVEKHGAK